MENNKKIIVDTVGKYRFIALLLFGALIYTPILNQGISYLHFSNMQDGSIYISAYGYIPYLLALYGYVVTLYLVVINIICFNKAIYIKNNELFFMWRKIGNVKDIDFDSLEFGYAPISIKFKINNTKKKINTAFLSKSNVDIVNTIKQISELR